MATRPVTVNDVLNGHVVLDLESFDQIYLHGYVPSLQVGGQVVGFLTRHLGFPIPSPALLEKIGNRFRVAVRQFAADHDVPVVRFARGDRTLDVMRPHLDRLAAQGRCGVAAIGVAQEFQPVFTATTQDHDGPGAPHFSFTKADRRVIAYYFYVVDETFGPAFIKLCAYFPLSDQDLAQRARACQTGGRGGRDRVYRRWSGRAATDLHEAGRGRSPGVLRALVVAAAAAADRGGPGCRLLVGGVDAPG